MAGNNIEGVQDYLLPKVSPEMTSKPIPSNNTHIHYDRIECGQACRIAFKTSPRRKLNR